MLVFAVKFLCVFISVTQATLIEGPEASARFYEIFENKTYGNENKFKSQTLLEKYKQTNLINKLELCGDLGAALQNGLATRKVINNRDFMMTIACGTGMDRFYLIPAKFELFILKPMLNTNQMVLGEEIKVTAYEEWVAPHSDTIWPTRESQKRNKKKEMKEIKEQEEKKVEKKEEEKKEEKKEEEKKEEEKKEVKKKEEKKEEIKRGKMKKISED